MTNSDRNSASPTSTWFGGTLCVPIALRTSDRTTTIFVNAVHISSTAGATPSTVTSRMIWTTWLGCPGTLRLTVESVPAFAAGPLGAFGPVGSGAAGRAATADDIADAAMARGADALGEAASAALAVAGSNAIPARSARAAHRRIRRLTGVGP